MNRRIAMIGTIDIIGLLVTLAADTVQAAPPPWPLTGAEIYNQVVIDGVGSFPRSPARDVSVDIAKSSLVFGDGGVVREILWRQPLRPRASSKSGDSITLTATLDWEVPGDPLYDGELVMVLSDGSRVLGLSFGLDGASGQHAAILHDECEFGDVYTESAVPADILAIPLQMPMTMDLEVGPDGATISLHNADPAHPGVTYVVPYTIDVTSELEFLVGGREAHAKHFALLEVDLDSTATPGAPRDKWGLNIRTNLCGPLDNNLPTALCKPVVLVADPVSCQVCDPLQLAAMDAGSFDVDGHSWQIDRFTPACVSLGTQLVNMKVVDDHGASDVCAATVTVVDQDHPVVTLAGVDQTICSNGPERVAFVPPQVSDTCGGMVMVTGEVVAIDGVNLPVPVTLDPNFAAVLQTGRMTLAWKATDSSGNVVVVFEVIDVLGDASLATCCPSVDWWLNGSNWSEYIGLWQYSDDFGVDARGGNDFVELGRGDDCVLAGSGWDQVDVGDGDNRVWGGSGGDDIYCGWWSGHLEAHGESGPDWIDASWCDTANIRGGQGDDDIYGTYYGDDMISPGSGHDHVFAQRGNDTVVLHDQCEFHPDKYLDGGPGFDTLIAPVPAAQLVAAGVEFRNFERYVVDTSTSHLADCP